MEQAGKLLNCVNMARDCKKKAGIFFLTKKPVKWQDIPGFTTLTPLNKSADI